MAGNKARRRVPRQQAAARRPPRFVFEAGEKSVALEAKTVVVVVGSSGTADVPVPKPAEGFAHLRALGVRFTAKFVGGEAKFLDGPSVTASVSRAVPDTEVFDQDLCIVGPPGTVVVAVSYAWIYKDH
jgi:hypothetical protein